MSVGFSKKDLDNMDIDEYDFHFDMAIEMKKAGKSFSTGIGLI